jgi:hypothetical protein
MPREPRTWTIRNPLTLPLLVTCHGESYFSAKFPSMQLEARGVSMDQAILNLAKEMQHYLEAHHVT